MGWERLEERILGKFPLDQWDERLVLVDVGSMGGIGDEWKTVWGSLQAVGFEPDEREFAKLTDTDHQIHLPWVVFSESRPLDIFLSRDHGKTSVYRPNPEVIRRFPYQERWDVVGTRSIPADAVVTLEEAMERVGLDSIDFLKLDTQGSELEILKGGRALVEGGLLGLRVEVSFLPAYLGQPLFPEVQTWITGAGFELFDLQRFYWKRDGHRQFPGVGQIAFGDALYLRTVDAFLEDLATAARPESRLVKLVVVCAVYGFHDYAVDVLEASARAQPELRDLAHSIRDELIAYDEFFYWDWMDGDRSLGNR